jgi:two-component system response regulator AtoC
MRTPKRSRAALLEPYTIAPERPFLVLAEDDDDIRYAIAGAFKRDGISVITFGDGESLIDALVQFEERSFFPDAVVLDHRMPGATSFDILKAMSARGWQIPTFVITAYGPEVAETALALGARAVFEKPFDADELLRAVHAATRPAAAEARPTS